MNLTWVSKYLGDKDRLMWVNKISPPFLKYSFLVFKKYWIKIIVARKLMPLKETESQLFENLPKTQSNSAKYL